LDLSSGQWSLIWVKVLLIYGLLKEPLRVEDGYYRVPTRPRLGVELDEGVFDEQEHRPWHRRFVYHKDGSVALT